MKKITIIILFVLAILFIVAGIILFINLSEEPINTEEYFLPKDNYSVVVTNYSEKSKIYIAMSSLKEKSISKFSNSYKLEEVKEELEYLFGDVQIDFQNTLEGDLLYSYDEYYKTINVSPIDSEGQGVYQEKINTKKEKDKIYVDYCILKFILTNETTREDNEPYSIRIYTKTDLLEEQKIHSGESEGQNFLMNAIEDNLDIAQTNNYKNIIEKHIDKLPKVRYTFEKYENRYIISNIELI